ncbi:MAG TPA: undecaprenyldiphospho-muramoylpentapeptide beta-N-acetylglucosaminyltransferase [Candidatus Dormibacteraeota bacterium]|jgi:UDP-N-acetylglucosamine--N-acetylmuramyl-(pentapeptide) pyrophosphoryl-undecaprenol N-acetylglucosamine transferase|nr:undecaprenyldiphospho-muramoylpentapeptide beta-N-acetylglucosaminyltransferase [Candidatus Dormibacteraeota bacterium]
MRAILAGGGTGGHVIPALAIANELKKSYAAEVLFIGTARGIENRLVPAAGYPLQLVRVGALKNVSFMTRVKTAFDLPRAVWDAGRMLNEFAPDVVIGVGGYASGPAMLAAVVKHVPTLAFEPNVVPGFANRVVARFVSGAAVHFEETAKYFRHAEVTGVPVRQAFFDIAVLDNKERGGTPTLLVFGGSQGAHAINDAMIRCLPELRRQAPGIHIIHQTGERDYNDALAAYRNLGESAEVSKFIEDMPAAFARADLVVCRSGASTVAEITAAGKPAIFVPFPRAADDHQRVNAEALAREGAAVVVEESKLQGVWLAETIAALLNDPPRLQAMSEAARSLAHPNAARDIAAMAVRVAGIDEFGN